MHPPDASDDIDAVPGFGNAPGTPPADSPSDDMIPPPEVVESVSMEQSFHASQLCPEVTVWPTRWNATLTRTPASAVRSVLPSLPTPAVISIPMGRSEMRTRSYFFTSPLELRSATPMSDRTEFSPFSPETGVVPSENDGPMGAGDAFGGWGDGWGNASHDSEPENTGTTGSGKSSMAASGGLAPWEDAVTPAGVPWSGMLPGSTRIRPPRDVIRLEDRLHYLLQPSLQQVFASRSLSCPFRPFGYQFEGVAFLYAREMAMLADEMGLGKTMQAILAIRLLFHAGELRSVLLICPKPLVNNWYREFSLWAPEIPIQIVEGDQARRHWLWRLENVPLRIANYELVTRDREVFFNAEEDPDVDISPDGDAFYAQRQTRRRKHRSTVTGTMGVGNASSDPVDAAVRPVEFDLVILDESQRIKNRSNTTSQVVRGIRRRRSWALTGTPVENSSDDLLGIFEFLSPGFLSPEMSPRRMGEAVRDCVIRRTKDVVLTDMPPKLYRDASLELMPEQKESYTSATSDGVIQLTDMGDSVTIQHVLELVLRLKQICNFDPRTGASVKAERLEADLEEIARSGRKALVFSQWVGTLERLGTTLARFNPLQYHGRIPSKKRDGVIEEFRNNPDRHVLLMSYGAGGVGLNLQFAQYVFLFDRWWNPALEDQAINRAHRIGAAGQVTVTRFLISDTIEERIDRILQEKRELFDTIFSETDTPRKSGLTHQEIFGLFDLKIPQLT